MKNLTLILALLLSLILTACGSGGGGSGGSTGGGHVPDTTPHDYTITVAALTNTGINHPVDIHQVCDFGYFDVRDDDTHLDLIFPNITGGTGCNTANNVIYEVENTGVDSVYAIVYIDGNAEPQVEVLPGTTYTFMRGY